MATTAEAGQKIGTASTQNVGTKSTVEASRETAKEVATAPTVEARSETGVEATSETAKEVATEPTVEAIGNTGTASGTPVTVEAMPVSQTTASTLEKAIDASDEDDASTTSSEDDGSSTIENENKNAFKTFDWYGEAYISEQSKKRGQITQEEKEAKKPNSRKR